MAGPITGLPAALRFARATDGVELAYEDHPGSDPSLPPIVFLHGYTSYRGTWFGVVRALRGRYAPSASPESWPRSS